MRLAGLLRIGNCSMAFLGVLIGAISELIPFEDRWWLPRLIQYPFEIPIYISVILAAMVAFLITGAGNALNDYYDRDIDRKAHPDRPIPSGEVRPASAWNFALSLFIAGLALSVLVNIWCFLIAALNIGLLFAYESRLKATGLPGNMVISYLSASVFLFGGASIFGMMITPILFLLAFLANVGREVTKDIEDMKADKGFRETLPITKGRKVADRAAIGFTLAAVALSPVPYLLFYTGELESLGAIVLSMMGLLYLSIVILADGVFMYSCSIVPKDPHAAQKYMKWGMMAALLAFISPSLFIWLLIIMFPS